MALFVGVGYEYSRERLENVEDFLSARDTTTIPLGLATFIAYLAASGMLFSPSESGRLFGTPAIIGYGIVTPPNAACQ